MSFAQYSLDLQGLKTTSQPCPLSVADLLTNTGCKGYMALLPTNLSRANAQAGERDHFTAFPAFLLGMETLGKARGVSQRTNDKRPGVCCTAGATASS